MTQNDNDSRTAQLQIRNANGGGHPIQSTEFADDGGAGFFKFRLPAYIRQEDGVYAVYCPILGVASYGKTIDEAKKNIAEATQCFLEGCYEMGTLNEVLLECGFKRHDQQQRRVTRKKSTRKLAGDWDKRFHFPAQVPLAVGYC